MQRSALPRPQFQPRTTVSLTVLLTSREGLDSRLSNSRAVASENPHHKRGRIRAHAGSWSVVVTCFNDRAHVEVNRFCFDILKCVPMADHMLESDLSTSKCFNLIVGIKKYRKIFRTAEHVIESDRKYWSRRKFVADDTCTYSHNCPKYYPQDYPQYYPKY